MAKDYTHNDFETLTPRNWQTNFDANSLHNYPTQIVLCSTGGTNLPSSWVFLIHIGSNQGGYAQICIPFGSTNMYLRTYNGSEWTAWKLQTPA